MHSLCYNGPYRIDNVDIQVSPGFHFDLNVYATFDVYIALDFNFAPNIKAEPM